MTTLGGGSLLGSLLLACCWLFFLGVILSLLRSWFGSIFAVVLGSSRLATALLRFGLLFILIFSLCFGCFLGLCLSIVFLFAGGLLTSSFGLGLWLFCLFLFFLVAVMGENRISSSIDIEQKNCFHAIPFWFFGF